MLVLSLDSATESASCALIEDSRLLGEITFNYKKQHSVVLMPMIDLLLKNVQKDLSDVDGFVVSKGPGSFTGLRIGMATIKGLSQGTGKPFIGVSSLDALAYNMAYTEGLICPILDALRDNVYTAVYEFNDSKLNKLSDYLVIGIDELINTLKTYNKPICFIGDGVPKFKDKLKNSFEKVTFAPYHLNLTKASSLGELGIEALKCGNTEDIYTCAPIYIRKSQAEREYDNKMRKNKNE